MDITLIKPLLTEKASSFNEKGKFTFIVKKDANKIDIKKAVEKTYKVTVKSVNTINVLGKLKSRFTKRGIISGRKPSYKLAIKESDWFTYWGSNKLLKEVMELEPIENFERCIIKTASNKKLLTYYETKYQFIYQVLEKPDEFYNDNILGKFYTKDFDL